MFYTAVPVVARGIMEKMLPEATAAQFPELYLAGASDTRFSLLVVVKIGVLGIFHATVVTFLPLITLEYYMGVEHGDMCLTGIATYICIVVSVTLILALDTW